ncbi:MAG TPA: XdhC family protein [Pseudomonadales bacterium]|nr:XdhC family protein [Pseudomonadales bacterium]
MQAVDQEVLTRIRDWLAAGEDCFLCTIVATYGSSPRPVGSLLACNASGELVGSLSGGCVEDDLIEQLRAGSLVQDEPRRLTYGLAPEDTEKLGLPCGGTLEIVAERIVGDAENEALFGHIVERLAARDCVRRTIELAAGARSRVEDVEVFDALTLREPGSGPAVLRQVYGPRQHLFLIGAGMVSRYLAEFAQALNFEVTVCDPREEMIAQWTLDGVRLVRDMPDDAIRAHGSDARTAIIALTHDPRIDDMGLMEALETDAFYVGAMGSRKTSESRRARLRELGLDEAALARLRAPVGLPIGSKTPPEIAISIVAELTQVLRSRAAAVSEPTIAAAG